MSISETVSENRKRGRPRMYGTMNDSAYAEITTTRGRQNRCQAIRALGYLRKAPHPEEFAWLFDPEECHAGRQKLKFHILTELGRFYNATGSLEEFWSAARWVCSNKPPAKEAVRVLRRLRLGEQDDFDAGDLEQRIATVINDYGAMHPAITPEGIREALRNVWDRVLDNQKDATDAA